MKDIAIYGIGGWGRECLLMINQINQHNRQWKVIGFFDDSPDQSSNLKDPYLGNIESLNRWDGQLHLILALGSPENKKILEDRIVNSNISYPKLIHPHALVGEPDTIGQGTCITAGSILTTNIQIGKHVLINLNSTIGHDVVIGSYSSIMPGANISGNVVIGSGTLVGAGANILPGVKIGTNCKIGAGAVVTKDIGSAKTAVGVPAKPLEN